MDQLVDIARKTGDLPALPQVASRVMQMVSDSDTSAADLEKVIMKDQALAARVLKIANSAAYGLRSSVTSIHQAVAILGLRTLNSLVIASSAGPLFASKKSSFKDKILWEHSLSVAVTSKLIAGIEAYPDPEAAFVGGLLHDIGKVVLDKNSCEDYELIVARVFNEGITFVEAEQDTFGFTHAEVGGLVIKKWKFAPIQQDVVQYHHCPEKGKVDPKFCAVISLANSLCTKLCIGPERRPDLDLSEEPGNKILGIDSDRLEALAETVQETLAEDKQIFSVT